MKPRNLGSSSFQVSALGIGAMNLSVNTGEAKKKEGIAVLRYAVERGINFFDTLRLMGRSQTKSLSARLLLLLSRENA